MLVLSIFSILCCTRKPLYLIEDCQVSVNVIVEAEIDSYWNYDWRDSLKYSWDENELGKIGYTVPSEAEIIFLSGIDEVKRDKIRVGRRSAVGVDLNNTYDLIIYNKTETVEESESGYYIYTPEIGGTKITDIGDNYITVSEPGEVFGTYIRNVTLPDDEKYYEISEISGKTVYVYNINTVLEPLSYIYLIQFIFVNDDSTEIEASGISNFTISGISSRKNLISGLPEYTGLKQISSEDVKPGQDIDGNMVFVSRVTVLGLLPEDSESSWSSQIDYLYYSNIEVETRTLGKISGTVDITSQINRNPRGGVVTIRILNSELKGSAETGDSFGVDVGEWEEHIVDLKF